jgi:hypothetical protein
MTLEELHGAFVSFRSAARRECSKVVSLAGARILFT